MKQKSHFKTIQVESGLHFVFLLHGMTCSLETNEEMLIGVNGKRSLYSFEIKHNLNILKIVSQNFLGSDSMKKCLAVLGLL